MSVYQCGGFVTGTSGAACSSSDRKRSVSVSSLRCILSMTFHCAAIWPDSSSIVRSCSAVRISNVVNRSAAMSSLFLAVAAGSLLAGIPGALFAVPFVAVLNVMVHYVSSGAWRDTPPVPVEAPPGAIWETVPRPLRRP